MSKRNFLVTTALSFLISTHVQATLLPVDPCPTKESIRHVFTARLDELAMGPQKIELTLMGKDGVEHTWNGYNTQYRPEIYNNVLPLSAGGPLPMGNPLRAELSKVL